MGKLGRFSQGLDPGPAQGLTWASPGLDPGQPKSIFWSRFWSNRTTETTAFTANGARPLIASVPAAASVVLFDPNLDQKTGLGWPGSSPGLGQGQALGWALVKPWENWPRKLASHASQIMPNFGMTGPCHATGRVNHSIMPPLR